MFSFFQLRWLRLFPRSQSWATGIAAHVGDPGNLMITEASYLYIREPAKKWLTGEGHNCDKMGRK